MPELRSLRTVCKDQISRTTAVLQVKSGLQLEVSGQADLQHLQVGLIGQQWSARLASPSKVRYACVWLTCLQYLCAAAAGKFIAPSAVMILAWSPSIK